MNWDYQKHYGEMVLALQNEVHYVWFCDHIMDNTFVDSTLEGTIRRMPENYLPVGFCYNPNYRPQDGVGFALKEKSTDADIWIHVPKVCFERWLDDAGLIKKMFPNGTLYVCKEAGNNA